MSVAPGQLPPAVVIKLASILTLDDGAFIVGGQALNLWAERYASKTHELAADGPYTSKDLDFFGMREAAAKLAEALDGELSIPEQDDSTPASAKVRARIDGIDVEARIQDF